MINFQKIRYTNFLATGSAGNEVILNKAPSTLINAKNGSGKSTILDAIVFSLFGKPFRDITKNQLINSINGKNCLVELWFSIGADQYHIRRGIKPNIFEIYKGDTLIDQEAATRDYQKFLETQILKTNIKAFTQSAILGTANFTPFMKMRPFERREITEDFLDVKIFGVMNQILKQEIAATKTQLTKIEGECSVAKTKVDGQKKLIKKLEEINEQAEAAIRTKIELAESIIEETKIEVSDLEQWILEEQKKQVGMNELGERISEMSKRITELRLHMKGHKTSMAFFESNSSCPSCRQEISEQHKGGITKSIAKEYISHKDELDALIEESKKAGEEYEAMVALDPAINEAHSDIRKLRQTIKYQQDEIAKLEQEILDLSTTDLLNEKVKLKELAAAVVAVIDEKSKLSSARERQDAAYEILKDSGVKTTIIKEYLPIINELINKYLGVMEFYVDFNLDEEFNEVIRSRCRDEFTYASFSEGEKKRLDIAILFAWRQIAKMKNSVNCNILFLDEILESGLDEGGLDAVFQIIEEEAKQSNVFVISHADRFKDRFDTVVSIEKVGDFSVIQ